MKGNYTSKGLVKISLMPVTHEAASSYTCCIDSEEQAKRWKSIADHAVVVLLAHVG
jgi:hypothetical protein